MQGRGGFHKCAQHVVAPAIMRISDSFTSVLLISLLKFVRDFERTLICRYFIIRR